MDTKYVAAKVKQLMTDYNYTVILHFGFDVKPEDIKDFVSFTGNSIDMEFETGEMFVCTLVGNKLSLEWLADDIFEIVPKYKNFVNIEIFAANDVAYRLDSIVTNRGFNKSISPEYIKNIREIVSEISPDVIMPFQLYQLHELLLENDFDLVVSDINNKLKSYSHAYGQFGFRESNGYSFKHGTPVFKEFNHKTKERVFISLNKFYDNGLIKI